MPVATSLSETGLEEPLPLFVYGTLRQGECNHNGHLAGRFVSVLPALRP